MKFIVTGGGGFVGKALACRLRESGHEVYSLSRKAYPELEEKGICCVQADLSSDPETFQSVFEGADGVFHVAAKVEMWGDYQGFYEVNVLGTRNLLSLCKKFKVKRFVYTSSPSVVADGSDLCGIDESYPYPETYKAFYPQTKAEAEKEVLAANSDSLWTLSLRPHLIWGPGDTNLVPTILERARAGRLVQVGDASNEVDLCFIDDCVDAHILAFEALENNSSSRGRAYFISQGEPVKLWQWIQEVLKRNHLPPIKRKIPTGIALAIAGILEKISRIRPGNPEPLLTRFLVSEMATSHYFDISAAQTELNFCPKHTIEEALDLTFPQIR